MHTRSLIAAQRVTVASCALVALILSTALAARASELTATKDFKDAAAAANVYIDTFGAEHVLLVLDIDNTIMSMDGDLGSDHWFEWQHYLLDNEPDSPHLVAKTLPGLLEVQGILYERNHMHATQSDEPELIAKLQDRGIATVLLTSRGPEFRGPTERELNRCGYDFAKTALPVNDVPTDKYLAYDPANPEKDGLSPAEISKYKLTTPRPVLYVNGIFMTAGQHKGMMLLTLLKKAKRDIKAVVYVDDNVRHVGSVFGAAVARNIEISSFQYQHEELIVARFQYGDKHDVDEAWQAVKNGGTKVTAAKPQASGTSKESTSRIKVHRRCPRRCRPLAV